MMTTPYVLVIAVQAQTTPANPAPLPALCLAAAVGAATVAIGMAAGAGLSKLLGLDGQYTARRAWAQALLGAAGLLGVSALVTVVIA